MNEKDLSRSDHPSPTDTLTHASVTEPCPNIEPRDYFPIMGDKGGTRSRVLLPWSMIAPHEAQAQSNHDQTLARLAERGGLSPCEAVAILEDRKWAPMRPFAFAENRLRTIINERIAAEGRG